MSSVLKSISNIAEVQQIVALQSAVDTQQLLVIFDLDLTLTMPRHPAFSCLVVPAYRAQLQKILSPLSDTERRKVLALALQRSGHQLVEKDAPAVIKNIQNQGNRVIALTAALTGRLVHGERTEALCYQRLQKLGIDFQQAFDQKELILYDLPAYNENYPLYYQGILCANGEQGTNMKGPVLVSFLNHVAFRPQQVIMVDDKIQNLQDVELSLAAFDATISFIGIEYLGAYKAASEAMSEQAFTAHWEEVVHSVAHIS